MTNAIFPRLVSQGVDGLVVQFADKLSEPANRAGLALRADLETNVLEGVRETSPALGSVYVRFDPAETTFADLKAQISGMLEQKDYFQAELPHDRRLWTIPALFGGPRAPALEKAAELAGLSPDAAIEDLTSGPVRVLAIGFAPGQPYLGELGPQWNIPRLPELVDVPAAAIVLAIRQLVLFANPSPTGWQHVGQTAFRCFRPESENPIALRPGDEVQFLPVTERELKAVERDPNGGAVVEAIA